MSVLRIQRLAGKAAGDRPKGYNRSYRFLRDDVPIYQCHAYRWCMKPCEFSPLDAGQAEKFVLRSSRPFMPMTWIVEDKESALRHGSLKRKLFGKVDWRLRDAGGKQIATVVGRYERRSWLFRLWIVRFIDFFLGARLPDSYEIVSNGEILATIAREAHPQHEPVKTKRGVANLLGKVLVEKDWVVREVSGKEGRLDHRLLLCGVVLLEQISRDVSG